MGTRDRDYAREEGKGPGFFASIPVVVRWLLILNTLIFIIDLSVNYQLTRWGAFSIQSAIFKGQIWEFVTFQFLHASVGHVLFNMIGLYFFGPLMERWWGARKFLVFYLLSGIGGGLFFCLLSFAGVLPDGFQSYLVGASAGIYGVLIGVAVTAPQMRVRLLFPPIEMSMRTMAIAVLAIAAGSVILKLGANEGGEAGHLGGAILGFLLTRFPRSLGWLGSRDREIDVIRPRAFQRRSEAKIRPRSHIDLQRSTEVDLILDKISRDGFQSLTAEERETLQQAAKSSAPKP